MTRRRFSLVGASVLLATTAGIMNVVAPGQAASGGQVCSVAGSGTAATTFGGGGHTTTVSAAGTARCDGGPSGRFTMYSSVGYGNHCNDSTGLGLVHITLPDGDLIIVGLTVVGDTLTGIGKVESGPHRNQAAIVSLVSSRNLATCPNGSFRINGLIED